MPETCPNPWYFGGCAPTIEHLWHWTHSWERWVLYTLALVLAYTLIVASRVSYHLYLARRAEPVDHNSEEFQSGRKKLIAQLSFKVRGLKSVAATAPYLGLAGTCCGILGMCHGFAMEHSAVRAMLASELSAAPLSTAAGLIVAIAATGFYNLFRTRIEVFETEVESKWRKHEARSFRFAQSLPLAPRFSKVPLALIAAPVLALSIAGFMTFGSFHTPTGLPFGLAPDRCGSQNYERVIVLHVTQPGKVLINTEQVSRRELAIRLSEIYSLRVDRTLYLLADDDVSVQTVADAISLARSVSSTGSSDLLGIKVKLITTSAMKARCPEVWQAPPIPKLIGGKTRR